MAVFNTGRYEHPKEMFHSFASMNDPIINCRRWPERYFTNNERNQECTFFVAKSCARHW